MSCPPVPQFNSFNRANYDVSSREGANFEDQKRERRLEAADLASGTRLAAKPKSNSTAPGASVRGGAPSLERLPSDRVRRSYSDTCRSGAPRRELIVLKNSTRRHSASPSCGRLEKILTHSFTEGRYAELACSLENRQYRVNSSGCLKASDGTTGAKGLSLKGEVGGARKDCGPGELRAAGPSVESEKRGRGAVERKRPADEPSYLDKLVCSDDRLSLMESVVGQGSAALEGARNSGSSENGEKREAPARQANLSLLGLFDKKDDLDPNTPDPAVRADYRSFLKSMPSTLLQGSKLVTDAVQRIRVPSMHSMPTNEAKKEKEAPLFSVEEWKKEERREEIEWIKAKSNKSQHNSTLREICDHEELLGYFAPHIFDMKKGEERAEGERQEEGEEEKYAELEKRVALLESQVRRLRGLSAGCLDEGGVREEGDRVRLGYEWQGGARGGRYIGYDMDSGGALERGDCGETIAHSFEKWSSRPYSPNAYIYNQRFQEIIEQRGAIKYIQISALGRDFVQLANCYGCIIISERCLPAERKSIKPVALGGKAGGDKFVVQGIIFKYALDVNVGTGDEEMWLYGGTTRDDEAAKKAAGNELLGLSNFVKCNCKTIRFPLMALIDYCGYRLVAVSTLPIDRNTIVYGSADGGRTVHDDDAKVRETMEMLGEYLNLRKHTVSNRQLIGGGDVEVHFGYDGLYYMIDFARAFPPEAPKEKEPAQSVFYKLLRPELVRRFSKPLSSDAFSKWQVSDVLNSELNRDVIEATEFLDKVIADYTHKCFLSSDFQNHLRTEICNISELHRWGINLRNLGRVRQAMASQRVYDNDSLYLVEMICRTLKKLLAQNWRQLMDNLIIFAEEPFRSEALVLFNLLGQPRQCPFFWKVQIKRLIIEKYGPGALHSDELDESVGLLDKLDTHHRQYLVRRLAWHLNLHFEDKVWQCFQEAVENGSDFEFFPQDIKYLKPRIKYMTLIDLAIGISLYLHAAGIADLARIEANISLLNEAKSYLIQAWTQVSDCPITSYFLGKVWFLLGKLKPDGGDDFARSLLMFSYTLMNEYKRADLKVDLVKSAIFSYVFEKEPQKFQEAKSIYKEIHRTDPELTVYLKGEIISWLIHQQANKHVPDSLFKQRVKKTIEVCKEMLSDENEETSEEFFGRMSLFLNAKEKRL